MSIDKASPADWDNGNYRRIMEQQRNKDSDNKDYNKTYNNVHSPLHYNKGNVECIEAIESMLSVEEYIGYLRGNSMKYRWRFRYKNGFEDLSKAQWYEKRLVKFMEDHNVLGSQG